MTVCLATLFRWNYGTGDEPNIGPAILTASDRMLTDEGLGIEYEASRWKVYVCDSNHLVLVSGDGSVMSHILQDFADRIGGIPKRNTKFLAELFGEMVEAARFQRAVKRYLAPLGVSLKNGALVASGIDALSLPEALSAQLIEQMQSEVLGIEAMVVGCDDTSAHLLHVDGSGLVSRHDDIGFLSIGNGGIHSSAYLMQLPYDHNVMYSRAVLTTFLAKKRAEVSPGVGEKPTCSSSLPTGCR